MRQRLLTAARSTIAGSGIHALRISDVTARADVGFGTFYTYFENKDALVEAIVAQALESLASMIGQAAQDESDPAVAAAAAYRRFLRFGWKEPELASVLVDRYHVEGQFEEAVQPWATDTLRRGISCGRFDIPNVELCLSSVAASAVAAIRAILSGRLEPGPAVESAGAEMMLRSFGVDAEEARSIANLDLPALAAYS
ncbi:MAG: TetR/AcrR family transcriptional regulator [Mycobacterium kyogaense]|uniref:TetR/AcrR family transcriptional regulator n=1 Tax=Mycobacterium kyogaense TaxID=2212479 RepID=UPI002FFC0CB7